MSKKLFRRIAPIALPVLGTMIPGVGPVLGGALGGAAGGAVTGGGLKSILTGAALGGAGGYLSSGGLGTAAGTPLGSVTGNAAMQGPTAGTGVLGSITRNVPGLASTIGGLGGGGGATGGLGSLGDTSSLLRMGGSIFSGLQQSNATDEMEEKLLAAQGRAEQTMAPYQQLGLSAQQQAASRLAQGFDPSQLANDPGYQFRLQQGQNALQRQLAASGMRDSGAALKAAQEYGQNMASQQYDDAYKQWLARNSQQMGIGAQGQAAAGGLSSIYGDMGNVQASATGRQADIISNVLADVAGTRIVGFDPVTGRPIYG